MSSDPAAVREPSVATDVDNNTLSTANSTSETYSLPVAVPVLTAKSEAVEIRELEMSNRQSFRDHWRAGVYATCWASACIMTGYCLALPGNFYVSQSFSEKYGSALPDLGAGGQTVFELGAVWKTGLQVGALGGEIVGLYISGESSKKFGNKPTMVGAFWFMAAAAFLTSFAPNVATLVAGQLICGIPWGIFQTLPCTYIKEIAPAGMRPVLFATVNISWLLGQLLSAGVVIACKPLPGPWSYRLPFLLQTVFAIVLSVPVIFSPESPTWLVRNDRIEEAKKSLLRVTRRNAEGFCADDAVDLLVERNNIEEARTKGSSYIDCFKGKNWRRTRIAIGAWVSQSFCGSVLIGLSSLFYEEAGVPGSLPYTFTMVQSALGIVGGLLSSVLAAAFPRRNLFLFGLLSLGAVMLAIGGCSWIGSPGKPSVEAALLAGAGDSVKSTISAKAGWTVGLFLVWVFLYGCTIGPLAYSVASEIGSSRLTTNTIAIARTLYNVFNIVASTLANFQLTSKENPTSPGWGWSTRWTAIFWSGFAFLFAVWSFFYLPEQTGITPDGMDSCFERGIKARAFKKTFIKDGAAKRKEGEKGVRDNGTNLQSLSDGPMQKAEDIV
ncbi:hypothetical protein VTL71DRAFT_14953 [Oculimacula yallundae]|uniref:Major facilitator superfamily (MFS) profile domain-containing protein n=1 Tax=Oculimacula yallundae TaxID=86028 RepID=A0ABR4CGH7_9HELO